MPVSGEELALLGEAIGRSALVSREGTPGTPLAAEVVRQAAALDEQTRLGTLFLAADRADELMLGEFVGVEIRGEIAADVLRLPAASLTSRDQVWVVENEVAVVGNEGEFAVVRSFDIGDGVVAIPPSNGRDGLPVTIEMERRYASGGGLSVAAE